MSGPTQLRSSWALCSLTCADSPETQHRAALRGNQHQRPPASTMISSSSTMSLLVPENLQATLQTWLSSILSLVMWLSEIWWNVMKYEQSQSWITGKQSKLRFCQDDDSKSCFCLFSWNDCAPLGVGCLSVLVEFQDTFIAHSSGRWHRHNRF